MRKERSPVNRGSRGGAARREEKKRPEEMKVNIIYVDGYDP